MHLTSNDPKSPERIPPTKNTELEDKDCDVQDQEDHDEVLPSEHERDGKKNRNGCVIFDDQKLWCQQGKGTLVHINQLQSPKVTPCGMRTAALLNKVDMCNPQEILDIDLSNIKMDGASKVEEAIAKMVIMCENGKHFAAIDHLVDHLDELHDAPPTT